MCLHVCCVPAWLLLQQNDELFSLQEHIVAVLIIVAVQSKVHKALYIQNSGIVNSAGEMDVCLHFFVLCR
jgi:hypothetical protein